MGNPFRVQTTVVGLFLCIAGIAGEVLQNYECRAMLATLSLVRSGEIVEFGHSAIVSTSDLDALRLSSIAKASLLPYVEMSNPSDPAHGLWYIDDSAVSNFLEDLRTQIAYNWAHTQHFEHDAVEVNAGHRRARRSARIGFAAVFGMLISAWIPLVTAPLGADLGGLAAITGAGTALSMGASAILSRVTAKRLRQTVDVTHPKYSEENLLRMAARFRLDTVVDQIEEHFSDLNQFEYIVPGSDRTREVILVAGRHQAERFLLIGIRPKQP